MNKVNKGSVKFKNKQKPRKTYSLFSNDKTNFKSNNKRKSNYVPKEDEKRAKLHDLPLAQEESTSESETEQEDDMNLLRKTFSNVNKTSVAVESSDDSVSDEDVSEVELIDENVEGKYDKMDEICEENLREENEIDCETEKEEDNVENSQDPFVKHLFYDLSDSLLSSVESVPMLVDTYQENWADFGKLVIQIPKCVEVEKVKGSTVSIAEETIYASRGRVPDRINVESDSDLYIKSQIIDHIGVANSKALNIDKIYDSRLPLLPFQADLFSIINNYQDFYFPNRTFENAEQIRFVYCLHAVNHILKTRTKILHHNARLSRKDDVPEEFRDQGLVRPKILMIVPFKDAAYKIIQILINILLPEDKGNVINKNRFVEDYTGNEIVMPKKNPKPEDYELIFAGNTGDDFKIGVTVTKKSLKLYADFYSSDIVIASPLGLRQTIGADGEPERDYDFLASIELLVLDQTDIFMMQNWDHVLHVLRHLHLQPKNSHGTDFTRVRTWSLNGWARFYRQTLIFSSCNLPEINAVFNKNCFNYAGKAKLIDAVAHGSIRQVFVQLPHVFHRFEAGSAAQVMDARFEFFVHKILPRQKDPLMKQTLVFVSNYFDYVRLRNYFKREDISFVQICEYSKVSLKD